MVRRGPWFPHQRGIDANLVAASIQMNERRATVRFVLPRCGRNVSQASKPTESGMQSRDYIFWEVDVQADFMLPGGKLYVPGAEKILPNIRRLTDAARQDRVFLVSHGCFHTPNDPEFKIFPPHCVKGTPGSELVPEALTNKVAR